MAAFFQVRGILPETFQKLYKKNMWYFLESSNFTKKQLPDFPGSKIAIETPRQCVKSVLFFFCAPMYGYQDARNASFLETFEYVLKWIIPTYEDNCSQISESRSFF